MNWLKTATFILTCLLSSTIFAQLREPYSEMPSDLSEKVAVFQKNVDDIKLELSKYSVNGEEPPVPQSPARKYEVGGRLELTSDGGEQYPGYYVAYFEARENGRYGTTIICLVSKNKKLIYSLGSGALYRFDDVCLVPFIKGQTTYMFEKEYLEYKASDLCDDDKEEKEEFSRQLKRFNDAIEKRKKFKEVKAKLDVEVATLNEFKTLQDSIHTFSTADGKYSVEGILLGYSGSGKFKIQRLNDFEVIEISKTGMSEETVEILQKEYDQHREYKAKEAASKKSQKDLERRSNNGSGGYPGSGGSGRRR